MGGAIVKGVLATNALPNWDLTLVDPNPSVAKTLEGDERITYFSELPEGSKFDCALLAIKPQQSATTLPLIARHLSQESFVISIMAGRSIQSITEDLGNSDLGNSDLGNSLPIIRAMPNLPIQIGLGATAIHGSDHVTPEQLVLTKDLFSASGTVTVVASEDLIDVATAIIGSGPGFIFHLLAAAHEQAVEFGFAPEEAKQVLCQVVKGAVSLYEQSAHTLPELETQVKSPGGTTAAGLASLESNDIQGNIKLCLKMAYERAVQLKT